MKRKPVKYSALCFVFVTWSLIHLPQVSKVTAVTRAGEGMRPSGHAGVWWWQQFFQFPDLKEKSIEDGEVIRQILPMYLSYSPSSCGCCRAHPCAGEGTNDLFTCTNTNAPGKCLLWSEEILMTLYLGGIFQVKMIMKALTSFSRDAKRVFF